MAYSIWSNSIQACLKRYVNSLDEERKDGTTYLSLRINLDSSPRNEQDNQRADKTKKIGAFLTRFREFSEVQSKISKWTS